MHLKENQQEQEQRDRGQQRRQERREHPSVTMVRRMQDSDGLLEGSRALLNAITATGVGPSHEGCLAMCVLWHNAVRMAENGEEGIEEVTRAAMDSIQHGWDVVAGYNTRARIIRQIEADIAEVKRKRQERLDSDSDF